MIFDNRKNRSDVSGNNDSNILAINDHRLELSLTELKRLSVVSSGTSQV